MVSFTHCSRNPLHERRAGWAFLLIAGLLALACLMLVPTAARAQAQGHGEVAEMQLDHTADGLFLSASMQFDLPDLAEDALYKGISMYFVAETEVLRERWYWYDKVVARSARYMRLSYQPLTRRWRLNQSPVPFASSGLGVALGQSFEDLADALSAMQRIARWKVADEGVMAHGTEHVVNFQFRLDMSQLPRPFQIGAVGRSGWTMLMSRSARLMAAEPAR